MIEFFRSKIENVGTEGKKFANDKIWDSLHFCIFVFIILNIFNFSSQNYSIYFFFRVFPSSIHSFNSRQTFFFYHQKTFLIYSLVHGTFVCLKLCLIDIICIRCRCVCIWCNITSFLIPRGWCFRWWWCGYWCYSIFLHFHSTAFFSRENFTQDEDWSIFSEWVRGEKKETITIKIYEKFAYK